MFLLLALVVQIVKIHGDMVSFEKEYMRKCDFLEKRNADYGEDYISWTSVRSLSECQRKCETDYYCAGFTWVKDSRRNCALYDKEGTLEGVGRRNQDSYYCKLCKRDGSGCIYEVTSNGVRTRWGSSISAISDFNTKTGIGGVSSGCPRYFCKTSSRQCCKPPPGRPCKYVTSC